MTNRIPYVPLQKEVLSKLSKYQTVTVYENLPETATLPYIMLHEFTCKPNGAKLTDISDVLLKLHIWSASGREEVNQIANDVVGVLTSVPIDLAADNFNVLLQDVTSFEAYLAENNQYHGVITLMTKIQNLGG